MVKEGADGEFILFAWRRAIHTEKVEGLSVDVQSDVGGFKGRVVEVGKGAGQYVIFQSVLHYNGDTPSSHWPTESVSGERVH